jgi:hypothetical protein
MDKKKKIIIGISAAVVLLISGIIIYKRKSSDEESQQQAKNQPITNPDFLKTIVGTCKVYITDTEDVRQAKMLLYNVGIGYISTEAALSGMTETMKSEIHKLLNNGQAWNNAQKSLDK